MKKIAMFIGELSAEFQYRICEAVDEECKKWGIHLTVFHNFCAYGSNVFHSYGERSLVRIPNMKMYDGFILASDTFGVEGMYDELVAILKKEAEGRPVICLRKEDKRFYNVLVDDYSGISAMVEHFIVVHGFKRICFMKGREDLKDAQIRLQAYLDVMEKYHLEVTEHMLFNGDYWKSKGEQAVSWFWDDVEEKPEAIVCANDYMAISVLNALNKRGVKIPEQVCVSGFDDRDEARICTPPLSSVHVGNERLAEAAIDIFRKVWDGEEQENIRTVPAECCYRDSCGCSKTSVEEEKFLLFQNKEHLQNAVSQAALMNVDFENTNTLEEMFNLAAYYLQAGEMHEKIYVCFCDEEEKETEKVEMAGKYTEYMELRVIMRTRSAVFSKERFRRETILPEKYLESNETLYVNPLHDKNDCIGYFVMGPRFSLSMRNFYQLWVQGITNSIIKQRMFKESKELATLLDQYNLDELTGIPNRRMLDVALKNADTQLTMEGKSYFVASVDMDGLKYINDHLGHIMGDEALCALAGILKKEVGGKGMAARTGGDEFIICYNTQEEAEVQDLIQRIRAAVEEYNSTGDREYELSASIGYCECLQGMMPINCVQLADEMMYKEKRNKKGKVRAE